MNPVNRTIEAMLAKQDERHADIIKAGEQIRRWREEDKLESTRSAGSAEQAPASDR